ncbi:DUF2637 domain-containing protein [Saccharopolyspora erythraea]|uniref:DUF2637 domain-containing protein n=1 Tax=Saccharopolyspora erythraea TaxID=1836 RepID=UPI001BABC50F|nr:DUF2637 domain-containing protein [Saccharopolyspora erythraea]QUH01439.1 DUF2637 domain-containing protein [Saccharopolyspora erythraea]
MYRKLASVAVAVPAVIAAVVSFEHVRELAEFAGEEWRAWLLPLSADGLVIASSIAALTARQAGRKVHPMTVLNLVVGLLVSVAANILTPFLEDLTPLAVDVLSASVAAWPAVALALAFEELLRLRASASAEPETAEPEAEPVSEVPAEPEPEPEPVAEVPEPVAEVPEPAEAPAERKPKPNSAREEAMALVRLDPSISGAALGARFGRTDRWGRLIKTAVAEEAVTQIG